jgi:hypothetical protein
MGLKKDVFLQTLCLSKKGNLAELKREAAVQ